MILKEKCRLVVRNRTFLRLDFQEAPTCDVPELEPQSEVLVPTDHLGQKIGAYRRSEIKKKHFKFFDLLKVGCVKK